GRDGGEAWRQAARAAVVQAAPRTGVRLFSARHEFPGEWQRFLQLAETQPTGTMTLDLSAQRFPFQLPGKTVRIGKMELYLKVKDGVTGITSLTLYMTPPGDTPNDASDRFTLRLDSGLGNLPHMAKAYPAA